MKLYVVLGILPPIVDYLLDFYNGSRAHTLGQISDAARSIYWAMFFNIVFTPSFSALFNREPEIENFIAQYTGSAAAKESDT